MRTRLRQSWLYVSPSIIFFTLSTPPIITFYENACDNEKHTSGHKLQDKLQESFILWLQLQYFVYNMNNICVWHKVTYRRWGDKTSYLKNFKCSGEPKNMAALTL